jgi:hypothetical protein
MVLAAIPVKKSIVLNLLVCFGIQAQITGRGAMNDCKQCPHSIGDRDCDFPDCEGGWESVSNLIDKQAAKIIELQGDLRILADALLQAKAVLENDLYRTRVKNAHDLMEEANDTALYWMSEP